MATQDEVLKALESVGFEVQGPPSTSMPHSTTLYNYMNSDNVISCLTAHILDKHYCSTKNHTIEFAFCILPLSFNLQSIYLCQWYHFLSYRLIYSPSSLLRLHLMHIYAYYCCDLKIIEARDMALDDTHGGDPWWLPLHPSNNPFR